MIKMNLQLFGGRGQSAPDGGTPGGGGGGGGDVFAPNGVGKRIYDDPQEALGAKGRPMGVEQATLGANPYFSPDYAEYSNNCQRCVVAYEARRRGYDVVAHATYQGDEMPRGDNFALMNFKNPVIQRSFSQTAKGMQGDVERMMSAHGDGARAILRVGWKNSRTGHVINIEQRNGKTIYRDAQTGHSYKPENFFRNVEGGSVSVTRVDNLEFSDTVGRAVTKDK